MDRVPLKKSNLTRAQFEQLSDVPPEDECIGDLGHIRCESSGQELVWSEQPFIKDRKVKWHATNFLERKK
jgi:hypothetical protein